MANSHCSVIRRIGDIDVYIRSIFQLQVLAFCDRQLNSIGMTKPKWLFHLNHFVLEQHRREIYAWILIIKYGLNMCAAQVIIINSSCKHCSNTCKLLKKNSTYEDYHKTKQTTFTKGFSQSITFPLPESPQWLDVKHWCQQQVQFTHSACQLYYSGDGTVKQLSVLYQWREEHSSNNQWSAHPFCSPSGADKLISKQNKVLISELFIREEENFLIHLVNTLPSLHKIPSKPVVIHSLFTKH